MAVRYVGAIEAIAVTDHERGALSFTEEHGRLTEDHRARIASVMEQTPYYDLKDKPHRFYLVDAFVPTVAKKTSAGGIRGLRYLDLSKLAKTYDPRRGYTSAELAIALDGTTWE